MSIRPNRLATEIFFLEFIRASVEGLRDTNSNHPEGMPRIRRTSVTESSGDKVRGLSGPIDAVYWPCSLLKLLWMVFPVSVIIILLSWERFISNEPFLFRGPMTVILSPGFNVSRSQPSALRNAFAPPSSACHRSVAPFLSFDLENNGRMRVLQLKFQDGPLHGVGVFLVITACKTMVREHRGRNNKKPKSQE